LNTLKFSAFDVANEAETGEELALLPDIAKEWAKSMPTHGKCKFFLTTIPDPLSGVTKRFLTRAESLALGFSLLQRQKRIAPGVKRLGRTRAVNILVRENQASGGTTSR
jgi:hypothetical protein